VPDAKEARTVRIGLAGGNTVRGIVRALVELLKRENPATVPPELSFHTACTGIHYDDSSTDPNAFVTHLLRVTGIEAKTSAIVYQAPPLTSPELREKLKQEPVMKEAAELFKKVDILVTSGSSWRVKEIDVRGNIRPARQIEMDEVDDHGGFRSPKPSQLKSLMKNFDAEGYERLIAQGVVADMLWQPLSFSGPVDARTTVEAMTLATLEQLPGYINGDMKVLLALGPYHYGGLPFHKGDVLKAALGAGPKVGGPLFTHLVCDHRTAGAAARAEELVGSGVEFQD
jgi:DNA-binding transcriptional regulator LsrR (DeoR family)